MAIPFPIALFRNGGLNPARLSLQRRCRGASSTSCDSKLGLDMVLGETEITGQIKNARRDRASRRTYWSGIELLLSESFISRTTHVVYKRIGVRTEWRYEETRNR
jgi:hypothetical protein